MAAGEWVSVRSQVELYTGLLAEVRRLVDRNPKSSSISSQGASKMRASGVLPPDGGRRTPLDEARFLDFTARTMFGINPSELGSSPERQPDLTGLLLGRCTRAADAVVLHRRRTAIWLSISLTALAVSPPAGESLI